MDHRKIFARYYWNLASLLILIAGAGWIWVSAADPASISGRMIAAPHPGFQAPDFSLLTLQAEEITLSNLRGNPTIINFWASWCQPCRAEMPAIQKVYDSLRAKGLTVLAINAASQDNRESVLNFTQEMRLSIPILLDQDGSVVRLYSVRAFPTTFFIDSQGIIREVIVGGPMSEALLRIRLEQLTGGE